MNRRIVIQVTAPSLLIGLLLFGSCVAGVWSVNRLQVKLANILSDNVASPVAAQEVKIRLRQLRFHSFLYVRAPRPERREPVEADEKAFELALSRARTAADSPEEEALVAAIEAGYTRYRVELEQTPDKRLDTRAELIEWADRHPVRHLAVPCHELLRTNEEAMEATALE